MLKPEFCTPAHIGDLLDRFAPEVQRNFLVTTLDGEFVPSSVSFYQKFSFADVLLFDVQGSGNETKWHFRIPLWNEKEQEFRLSVTVDRLQDLQAVIYCYMAMYQDF